MDSDTSESATTSAVEDDGSSTDPQVQGNGNGSGTNGGSSVPASLPKVSGKPTAAAATTTYVFPTNREMNMYWLKNTLGPKTWAGATFTASWNQWVTDSPKEWTKDFTGWSQRWGSALFDNAVNTTTLVWFSRAMGQDPRYRRCDCTGIGARLGHALALTLFSYNRSGNLVLAPPKIVAPFTGPMISRQTYYPDRYIAADALRGGGYYFAGSAAWNLFREFVWNIWD
jgi:hypothetical protein